METSPQDPISEMITSGDISSQLMGIGWAVQDVATNTGASDYEALELLESLRDEMQQLNATCERLAEVVVDVLQALLTK